MSKVTIEFKNVTKQYKLYKNDKQRFKAIFSKKIKPKMTFPLPSKREKVLLYLVAMVRGNLRF